MTRALTARQKAAAWDRAADNLADEVAWRKRHGSASPVEWEHIESSVIPSLKRRADIIRRNARKP